VSETCPCGLLLLPRESEEQNRIAKICDICKRSLKRTFALRKFVFRRLAEGFRSFVRSLWALLQRACCYDDADDRMFCEDQKNATCDPGVLANQHGSNIGANPSMSIYHATLLEIRCYKLLEAEVFSSGLVPVGMNIDDPMTRSKLTVVDSELLRARSAVTHK